MKLTFTLEELRLLAHLVRLRLAERKKAVFDYNERVCDAENVDTEAREILFKRRLANDADYMFLLNLHEKMKNAETTVAIK